MASRPAPKAAPGAPRAPCRLVSAGRRGRRRAIERRAPRLSAFARQCRDAGRDRAEISCRRPGGVDRFCDCARPAAHFRARSWGSARRGRQAHARAPGETELDGRCRADRLDLRRLDFPIGRIEAKRGRRKSQDGRDLSDAIPSVDYRLGRQRLRQRRGAVFADLPMSPMSGTDSNRRKRRAPARRGRAQPRRSRRRRDAEDRAPTSGTTP